jgi:hypothetical protein
MKLGKAFRRLHVMDIRGELTPAERALYHALLAMDKRLGGVARQAREVDSRTRGGRPAED